MHELAKGGRGRTVSYQTKQMRIPTGLEPHVKELIDRYRDWVQSIGADKDTAKSPPSLWELAKPVDNSDKPVDNLESKPVDNSDKPVDNLESKPVDRIEELPEVKQMA